MDVILVLKYHLIFFNIIMLNNYFWGRFDSLIIHLNINLCIFDHINLILLAIQSFSYHIRRLVIMMPGRCISCSDVDVNIICLRILLLFSLIMCNFWILYCQLHFIYCIVLLFSLSSSFTIPFWTFWYFNVIYAQNFN